jgi:hypothetical protein
MNIKMILALFGVMLFGAGTVMAMSNATTGTEDNLARWNGLTTAGAVSTEGGNISGVNVTGLTLTDRWASFFGNVTGAIQLTDSAGTNDVYNWSWNATDGEVCLSQDQNFPWASAALTTGATIDTVWVFATGADKAVDTYTDATYPIDLSGLATITSTGTVLKGSSSFDNVAIGDATQAAEGDFAFCTDIDNAGTNYNNAPANYEIMVPTSDGAGTPETYYFFAELN